MPVTDPPSYSYNSFSLPQTCSNHMELVKAEHTDRESAPVKFGKALQIAQLVRWFGSSFCFICPVSL